MNAICDNGHTVHIAHRRGARLSAHQCGQCGGSLHLAKYERGGRLVRARGVRTAGQRKVRCLLCRTSRLHPGPVVVELTTSTVIEARRKFFDEDRIRLVLPAGSFICRYHGSHDDIRLGHILSSYFRSEIKMEQFIAQYAETIESGGRMMSDPDDAQCWECGTVGAEECDKCESGEEFCGQCMEGHLALEHDEESDDEESD